MPAGQRVVTLDPGGQYPPMSQISPVVPSVGVGLEAPSIQKWPPEHWPAGDDRPSASQYIPPEMYLKCIQTYSYTVLTKCLFSYIKVL